MNMETRIERGFRFDPKDRKIEWARLNADISRGVVFVPPLIGGSFAQQLNLFRWLARLNLDIFSFNYSGHGKSTDKFSLKTSIENTLIMAEEARKTSRDMEVPLFGVAGCYSAMPLLFAAQSLGEPFSRIVLINPLTDLKPFAVIKSFISYYRKLSLRKTLKKNIIEAIRKYTEFLFPDIAKDKHSFGVLKRERTHLRDVIFEFFLFAPLKRTLLQQTPVLCLYAKKDPVLNIYSKHRFHYENEILKICPLTRFEVIDGDHFFQPTSARRSAQKTISSFLTA
jgi:hypothetical protein